MVFELIIKPIVFDDAEEAVNYYEKKVKGLGNRFYKSLLASLEKIQLNPLNYSYIKKPVSGDAKAYTDCWHIQPYSVILISTADGKAFSIPAEAMTHPSSSMGQGGFATATNYKMSIHGDNGWVSFDEVSTAKDGTKSYSYEIWMVEKFNGEWKFVAASMHFYKQP